MMAAHGGVDAGMSGGSEATYTYGHSAVVVGVHARRTAASEAAFFLPHLRPGMRLLDVGCGPGSITVGLARAVAPGEVTGVDLAPDVLETARVLAAEEGLTSLRFETARAEALPFPDASFDAVFAHTLLEHVPDATPVLREIWRVLKPGGLLGLRDADWGSGVIGPDNALVTEAMSLYERVWRLNGGHPNCGRYLRGLLLSDGWSDVRSSASFRWNGSSEESRSMGELLADRLLLPNFTEPVLAQGWADRARLEQISAACLAWSRRPDAFAAMIMCEAVAVRGE
jgi:SAM-dependent methyltransferase